MRPNQSGSPNSSSGRVTGDRFDIVAALPDGARSDDWRLMVQSLLRDRFHLKFHLEPRPAPVYVLSIGRKAQLAARLSRSIGVMVIDKTGLSALFDIDLEWTVEDQFRGRGASASPTMFVAIQDQLGLKLESARAPVDVLVVDSAEKPAPD